MPPVLTRTSDALELNLSACRGAEFQDALAKVKDVPGSKFDWANKVWLLPDEPSAAERVILTMQPQVAAEVKEWVQASKVQREAELVTNLPDDADDLRLPWASERMPWQPETVNDGPFTGLKPHQRALVSAVAARNPCKAIIADDMGLGKTIEAIAAVHEYHLRRDDIVRDAGPKLIVCPNSVKGVWKREVARWLGSDEPCVIVNGSTSKARKKQLQGGIDENAWVIVNYEQLRVTKTTVETRTGGRKTVKKMKEPVFQHTGWAAVIADEVHRAKNRKAAQTQGLWLVQAPVMLGLSGTPLMNSPDELWAILHWLFPTEYTSYWRFYEKYVEYTEGFHGRVITGVKNPDALRFEIAHRLYRRTKAQVLDLPEKFRVRVPVTLPADQRKVYTEAETGLWLNIEKAAQEGDSSAVAFTEAAAAGKNVYTIPNGAARTTRLRQVLSTQATLGGDDVSAKLDAIEEAIADNPSHQHVVFSEFVDTCYALVARLIKRGFVARAYTGETDDRTELEDAFQRGEVDVVVGTISAMREGVTLSAADTMHFVERSWVPAWNEQAEDRCHRIGQANQLTIYIYEAEDTVDDGKVAPTNRFKERIVAAVLPKDTVNERAA